MPDIRVQVDFNDIGDDGRLGALTRYADDPAAVRPGAHVLLWDDEGNTVEGQVAELTDRGLAWIQLNRATWRDRPAPSSLAGADIGLGSFSAWSRLARASWIVNDVVYSHLNRVFGITGSRAAAPVLIMGPEAFQYQMSFVAGAAPATAAAEQVEA